MKKRPIETPVLRARAPVAAAARATSLAADAVEILTASQGAVASRGGDAVADCDDGNESASIGALAAAAMIRLSSGAVGGASSLMLTNGSGATFARSDRVGRFTRVSVRRGGCGGPNATAGTVVQGTNSGVRGTSTAGVGAAGTWTAAVSRKVTTGATCVESPTASARAVTLTRLVALASRAPRSRLESSRRPTRTRRADAVVVAVGTPGGEQDVTRLRIRRRRCQERGGVAARGPGARHDAIVAGGLAVDVEPSCEESHGRVQSCEAADDGQDQQ